MQSIELSDELQLNLPAKKTKIPGNRSKLFYSKYGRQCITCKKFKRWENFSDHKIGFNGKTSECKECCCERAKQWHLENRGDRLEYKKQWHLRNREARSEYMKQWYLENRESHLENRKQYFRSPKGRLVAKRFTHKRRTRLRMIINEPYSLQEYFAKFAYVNILLFGDRESHTARCPYCKRELKLSDTTLDHFIPISRNGNDTLSNIIPCCKSCNSSKHNRSPHSFLKSIGLKVSEQILIKHCSRDTWITDALRYGEMLTEIIVDIEAGLYD